MQGTQCHVRYGFPICYPLPIPGLFIHSLFIQQISTEYILYAKRKYNSAYQTHTFNQQICTVSYVPGTVLDRAPRVSKAQHSLLSVVYSGLGNTDINLKKSHKRQYIRSQNDIKAQ